MALLVISSVIRLSLTVKFTAYYWFVWQYNTVD